MRSRTPVCASLMRRLLLVVGCAFASCAWAQPACERFELSTPVRNSEIADRQPELRWNGGTSLKYRIQVAVVLPEGRVLESIDTMVVGAHWRLRAPVTVSRSVVKVIVSRNCPDYTVQDLHAQGPYFVIDATSDCALAPRAVRMAAGRLQWVAPAASDKLIVQIFSIRQETDGTVLTQRIDGFEVVGSSWLVPGELKAQLALEAAQGRSLLASVQAQCGSLLSQPQAILLDLSR